MMKWTNFAAGGMEGVKELMAAFSMFSTLRFWPEATFEVMFGALRQIGELKEGGAQKIASLKPAYSLIGQKKFRNYDRFSHEHCFDYIATNAFNWKTNLTEHLI